MTNDGMTHEAAREALEAFALDALDGSERSAVLSHLARCATCQAEVADLQAAAAELSYVVAPVPMAEARAEGIRARLLARASADSATRRTEGGTAASVAPVVDPDFHPSPSYHILVPRASPPAEAAMHPRWILGNKAAVWIAMAASVIALVSVGVAYETIRQRDTLATAIATLDRGAGTAVTDSLRALLTDRDRLIRNLTGPRVEVVTLASNTARAASARMFWDQSVDAWTFVGHNLPQPRAGRTYQLWLVTASAKISAGTFTPSANGDAVVRATYPLPPDALAAVAVTDEPSAGSPQPTTVPFIVGTRSGR